MSEPLLVSGGSVWTGNNEAPRAEAFLVLDGRFVAVGDTRSVFRHPAAHRARRIHLGGETVVPGLTDGHLHLATTAKQQAAVDLSGAASLDEVGERLRSGATKLAPDAWLSGVRLNETRFAHQSFPTRAFLDALGIPNPLLVTRVCTHIFAANSAALRRAGLAASGDGILKELDAAPVTRAREHDTDHPAALREAIARLCRELAYFGVTHAHTCGSVEYGMPESLHLYQRLHRENALAIRVSVWNDRLPGIGLGSGLGDDRVRFGGFKIFLDGTLGARTAALSAPYADAPGECGLLLHSDDHVAEVLKSCLDGDIQPLIHAIGDAALDQAIRILRRIGWTAGVSPLPVRMNHVQVCRPDQIDALAELGVVCDVQPAFVPSDLDMAPLRLGPDRLGWAYAWKKLLRAGIPLVASSDAPVETINPWAGIRGAVCRTDATNLPDGGWLPEERLSLDEALHLFATGGPKALGEEYRFGRIAPGYAADFALLDRDIFGIPPERLDETRPRATFVDGAPVWQNTDEEDCIP